VQGLIKNFLFVKSYEVNFKIDISLVKRDNLGDNTIVIIHLDLAYSTIIHIDFCKHKNLEFCKRCIYGKERYHVFVMKGNTCKIKFLGLIHYDVNGLQRVLSHGRAKFLVTFIDNFSRKTFVYFINQNSKILEKFKIFETFLLTNKPRDLKNMQ